MARALSEGISLAFGVAALCIAQSGCGSSSAAPAATPNAAADNAPPDFELGALDGSRVRLSDFLGKQVVLLDFWATYCEPCLRAMPALDSLYMKYKGQGFVVLGVAIDGPDSLGQVRADVQRLGVRFPILLDQDTRVVALYNPKTSAPFSVLIGKRGEVLLRKEGYTTSSGESLERDIASALQRQ